MTRTFFVAALLLAGTAARAEDAPFAQGWRYDRPRQHDSREGLLFSFGIGGGSLHTSAPTFGTGRHGAVDFDLRIGYGFSDRFQLFGDFGIDSASYRDGTDLTSWTMTIRGQTVLVGDRAGNGLNANIGFGFGGLTSSVPYYGVSTSSGTGLALAGGLSYDARLSRMFSLSPEIFYVWHQVPNDPGFAADVANTWGLRLNFLWYVF